eukprot:14465173-Alexandrium_andersonii.AAC.1
MYLVDLMEAPAGSQEGLGGQRLPAAPAPKEAVDLARAPFEAGATPGEVRASVAEVFSRPRVTAMAERSQRFG